MLYSSPQEKQNTNKQSQNYNIKTISIKNITLQTKLTQISYVKDTGKILV